METLRSIVYLSTATREMSEDELEVLLVKARSLNMASGVTGILLYARGNFMQCFEGSETAVATTYDRIRASSIHKGIIELVDETVPRRSFATWHMGFRQAKEADLLALSTAQWQRQLDAPYSPQDESAGLVLLRNFWARHGA